MMIFHIGHIRYTGYSTIANRNKDKVIQLSLYVVVFLNRLLSHIEAMLVLKK